MFSEALAVACVGFVGTAGGFLASATSVFAEIVLVVAECSFEPGLAVGLAPSGIVAVVFEFFVGLGA